MRKKYDVFISCKSEDYPLGRQIYNFLSNKGVTVFLADKNLRKLGISDYGRVIDDAIEGSTHMLVVSSSDKYIMRDTSPYVYYEWHTFSEEIKSGRKQGNLMTVLTEQSLMSKLPIALRNNQSFPFSFFTDVLPYISAGIELADSQSQSVNTVVNSKTKETACEQKDWENLDKGNYSALLTYRAKYPNSVHLEDNESRVNDTANESFTDGIETTSRKLPKLNGFRGFVESMVEEIILEEKPFDSYKDELKRLCENEGVDYDNFVYDLEDFIEELSIGLGSGDGLAVEMGIGFAMMDAEIYYVRKEIIEEICDIREQRHLHREFHPHHQINSDITNNK